MPRTVLVCLIALQVTALSGTSLAAVTAEHRRQFAELRKDLQKVSPSLAKMEASAAEKILDEFADRARQIGSDAELDEKQEPVASLLRQIRAKKASLSRKGGEGGEKAAIVTFEKDVAPILVARCLRCHGESDPRGELNMNTFAAILRGCGGKLVSPGSPADSVLLRRITASGDQRMPRGGKPLTADEIDRITDWIADGAKFAGDNSTPLAKLASAKAAIPPKNAAPVEIDKPTGGETVSFVRDIAPFMVNLCVNCHSGDGEGLRETGLSLETFEGLKRGGKSGRVLVPGNLGESRLWDVVGKQEPIKMPPGNSLITRTNHRHLRIWIEEGAKFDGTPAQARAPLRSLVPTEGERLAREIGSLSDAELQQRRATRAAEMWRAALGRKSPSVVESDGFHLIGNVAESRLEEVGVWAAEDGRMLRKLFSVKDDPIWRGRLTIFVCRDRFSYTEFASTHQKRDVPAGVSGHAHISLATGDAYVCLEDVGEPDGSSPGTRGLLTSLLTEALLQRSGRKVPDWAARGLGLTLAARRDPKGAYFTGIKTRARPIVESLDATLDIFEDGALSGADLTPVAYTLVTYMIHVGNESQFVRFVGLMTEGKPLADALKGTYSAELKSLARSYAASLGADGPSPKKSPRSK